MFSAVRSLCIACCGTILAIAIQRWLLNVAPARKSIAWTLLLLPFFTPSLMTGYCYRDTSMALVHLQVLREALYACIVMAQTVPVAVVILSFSPPPETQLSSLHAASLLNLKLKERLRLLAGSYYQYRFCAFCILFLISFQESDLAALMQASGWTEWMFTKHVGGLALSQTMKLSLWTVLIQMPLLIPIVFWLGKNSSSHNNDELQPGESSVTVKFISRIWLLVAFLLVVLIPLVQIARGTSIGIASLLEQPSVARELGDGILLATTTALLLIFVAVPMIQKSEQISLSTGKYLLLFIVLIPGTVGSLALGLLLSGIFQTKQLQFAYDTPVPLIIGEICILLPKAMILVHCLGKFESLSGLHWNALLSTSDSDQHKQAASILRWQLTGRRKFAMVAIIWCWAYFEVMLPSILAMPGLAPIGLVLYNNLHYGRIAALGAKLALMLLIPLIVGGSLLVVKQKMLQRDSF